MDRKVWVAGGIVIAAVGLTAGYLYMEKDRKKKLDAQKAQIDFKSDPMGSTIALKPVGGGSALYKGKLPTGPVIKAPDVQRKTNFRNWDGPYSSGNFCCDNF